VGTQNMEQPSTMGQPQTGQPQGIAPTVGVMVGVFKSLFTNEYIRVSTGRSNSEKQLRIILYQ